MLGKQKRQSEVQWESQQTRIEMARALKEWQNLENRDQEVEVDQCHRSTSTYEML